MNDVGTDRFCGISSDSTGNTKAARELVTKEFPHIIITPDPCHHLHNIGKDIMALPFFSEVSYTLFE
jgi:hypothetical protein